jgi:GWxTD domain-containing protein
LSALPAEGVESAKLEALLMKRTLSFFVVSLIIALPLVAQGLGELFQKAKEQVKTAHWADALKTLDALDGASREPGFETQRKQLEPALAFYRGVCLANTDRPADAQTQFETYLAVSPNASLDRAMYSKKAVDAFEKAQKKMSRQGESALGPSLAAAYRDFRMTDGAMVEPPKENWTEGPVKVLLTPEEKREWAGLSDAVSRSEFVTKFWLARDPRPETPENEFRQDFEKRIAFADKYFVQDETRGSLTDRGLVFLLLGPPTYAGRSPIGTGDDTSDSQGLSSVGRHDAENAVADARGSSGNARMSTGKTSAIVDRSNGAGSSIRDAAANWREVWHYRRELLPSGVPYQQVDFEFISRKGYGKNVLQRDSAALATMDAARQKLRASAGKSS